MFISYVCNKWDDNSPKTKKTLGNQHEKYTWDNKYWEINIGK